MQNFIVLASLASELAGGQNDPPPVLNVTKNTLVLEGLSKTTTTTTRRDGQIFQLVSVAW